MNPILKKIQQLQMTVHNPSAAAKMTILCVPGKTSRLRQTFNGVRLKSEVQVKKSVLLRMLAKNNLALGRSADILDRMVLK